MWPGTRQPGSKEEKTEQPVQTLFHMLVMTCQQHAWEEELEVSRHMFMASNPKRKLSLQFVSQIVGKFQDTDSRVRNAKGQVVVHHSEACFCLNVSCSLGKLRPGREQVRQHSVKCLS